MSSALLIIWSVLSPYVVESGDSLWTIARAHGCSVEALQTHNGLKSNALQPGDALKIPKCAGKKRPRAKRKRKKRRAPKKGFHRVNSKALPKLLRKRGFRPPKGFKALVVEIRLDRGQRRIHSWRPFDWRGTGDDTDWNPGSTIKLFSAVGAMEMMRAKGMRPGAVATFHDPKGKRRYRVSELVKDALGPSKNVAHNRLVQLAGYDFLNGRTLSKRRGLKATAIHKPYEKSAWVPLTGSQRFRKTPKVVLRQGGRKRTLPARKGKGKYPCPHSSACTTMLDIAEFMGRLMLHEQMPARKHLKMDARGLRVVRRALMTKRKRGREVADNLLKGIGKKRSAVLYHKPGFAGDWMSDVVYVYERRSRRRWIVALAGFPGRESVVRAARHIGEIIATRALDDY